MLEKIFNLIKKIKRVFYPFYKDKELKFVFQKFQEGHPSDKIVARFVGGCVRKYLSNDEIDDIDIATTLSSDEIKERFNNTNFRVVDTGIEHGTITLVSKKHKLEITTLRKDVETDGRHAEVEYIDDWKLDSERRDFTINAMAIDVARELLYDPHNGRNDISRGIIRAVGNAHQRLSEDGLRIMRAYRFADRRDRGVWELENSLEISISQQKHMLDNISRERIFIEWKKILSGQNSSIIIQKKGLMGILDRFLIGKGHKFKSQTDTEAVSYTHLTLPTNREV